MKRTRVALWIVAVMVALAAMTMGTSIGGACGTGGFPCPNGSTSWPF